MSTLPPALKVAWLLVATLISLVVALLVFMLKRGPQVARSEAVFAAGAAFAGSLVLCLTMLTTVVGT